MATVKEILNLAKPYVVKTELGLNTNNSWGFGGAVKDVYTLENGYTIQTGVASYRHSPSVKFTNLRNEKGTILTENKGNILNFIHQTFKK